MVNSFPESAAVSRRQVQRRDLYCRKAGCFAEATAGKSAGSNSAGGGMPRNPGRLHRRARQIEAFDLLFRRDPQADGFVDQLEHEESDREDPQEAGPDPEKLDADDFEDVPPMLKIPAARVPHAP